MSLTDTAISGPILVSAGLAVVAGAVSFASPCRVPLVPGYLAYLSGVVGADAPAVDVTDTTPRAGRWRVAGAALLFVLGFTVVFAAETITVLGVSDALLADEELLQRVGGVLAYCLGLGLPFVLLALGFRWAVRAAGWLRRHTRAVQLIGGVMLVAVGVLLVTGLWGQFIAWLRVPIGGFTTVL